MTFNLQNTSIVNQDMADLFSDVTIHVYNQQKDFFEIMKGNRVVLASGSEFFRKYFTSTLNQSNASSSVLITGRDFETMRNAVKIIYGNVVSSEKSDKLANCLNYLGVKFTFTPGEVTKKVDNPPTSKASEFSSPAGKEKQTRKRPAPTPAPATSGTRTGEAGHTGGEDPGKPDSPAALQPCSPAAAEQSGSLAVQHTSPGQAQVSPKKTRKGWETPITLSSPSSPPFTAEKEEKMKCFEFSSTKQIKGHEYSCNNCDFKTPDFARISYHYYDRHINFDHSKEVLDQVDHLLLRISRGESGGQMQDLFQLKKSLNDVKNLEFKEMTPQMLKHQTKFISQLEAYIRDLEK